MGAKGSKEQQKEVRTFLKSLDVDILKEPYQQVRKLSNSESMFIGQNTGQNYALKYPVSMDKIDLEQFRTESRMLAALQHPKVIHFWGVHFDPQTKKPCMVLDFFELGSVSSQLRKIKSDPETLFHLCFQLATGLALFERRGFVHRDVRAKNLYMDSLLNVKIAGFDNVRQISRTLNDGYRPLAVQWSAPEVLKSQIYTLTSDVWSFGMTCIEIFCLGKEPYHDISKTEAATKIKEGVFPCRPKKSEHSEEMPTRLYKLLKSCWELEPESRPSFKTIVSKMTKLAKLKSYRFAAQKQVEENVSMDSQSDDEE